MTAFGIIWLIAVTLVSAVAVRGILRQGSGVHAADRNGSTSFLWFLLALAFLLTNLPSGIDPFRAVGLHLGAAALLGFLLHVLTRGAPAARD